MLLTDIPNGAAFSLAVSSITVFAKEDAPSGTTDSVMCILNALGFNGIGAALGNLLGGATFGKYGGRAVFLYAGCAASACAILCTLSRIVMRRKKIVIFSRSSKCLRPTKWSYENNRANGDVASPSEKPQDVLLQIKEDILDRISCTTTRAVLALDIKGAFDNVSHTLVFENLASTGCGPRMYDYVRDFLSNWMATIGIESIRTSTIPIPSKGNRQGSVLSPTFGRQDFLEEVIETVQNYLEAGNLQRAPDKSQLLLLRAGKPIPEEEEGGHPPHRDGGAKYTVDRLVKTTTQVMRMVRRITSHRHGLEESDLIRLTQPLVVSHIACANPYLNLLSRGKGKMDVIIRKGY
ncbi:hypothetical protein ISCGN_012231 [Ixodes scapularis]